MFANNGVLTKFIFRRDRVRMLVWLFSVLMLVVGYGATFPSTYGNMEDLLVMADTMTSPAMESMVGPSYGYRVGEGSPGEPGYIPSELESYFMYEAGYERYPEYLAYMSAFDPDSDVTRSVYREGFPYYAEYEAYMSGFETNYSNGALYAVLMFVWTGLFIGIMNILHVVRHTRQDEERGRIEVIRSLPVGRLSNLCAAMYSAFILNLVIGLVSGAGLGSLGVEGIGMAGSMLFGAALFICGMLFAALTAVCCQLTANPRTAQGWSFGILVGAFIIRMMGDLAGNDVLSCISPLGLLHRSQFFVENNLWPILTATALTAIFSYAAFKLCASRDMGEGILAAKPGPADAKASLNSPFALARRLLKSSVIIWIFMVFMLGAAYGSVMGDLETFIETNAMFEAMSMGDPMTLIAVLIILMMTMSAMPVIQFILRARSEEKTGHAEHIIARAVSRSEQLKGYFIIALITCFVTPVLCAAGLYMASSPVMADPISFGRFFEACIVYVPALLFTLGVSMVMIAYAPGRAAVVSWGYLGYGFFFLYFGRVMGLPEALGKLAPFAHTPMRPVDEFTGGAIAALVIMTVLALVMFYLGFKGHSERDMKFSA